MQYLSRRYGVYRLSDGRYLLSTMTAGIRHRRDPVPRKKQPRVTVAGLKQTCCRYRPLFLVAAVLSASQGLLTLTAASTLLLMFSLLQYAKEVKTGKAGE